MSDKKEDIKPKEIAAEEYIFICKKVAAVLKTVHALDTTPVIHKFIEVTDSIYDKLQKLTESEETEEQNKNDCYQPTYSDLDDKNPPQEDSESK